MSELVKSVENVHIDGETEETKGPSKGELKKLQKKLEKEAKKAEHKAANVSTSVPSNVANTNAVADEELAHLYGDSPLICSKFMTSKSFKQISELNEDRIGQTVWIRARVHTSRAVGKGVFLLLRQSLHSIQAIAWQGENVPKAFIKYAASISLESVVDGKIIIY